MIGLKTKSVAAAAVLSALMIGQAHAMTLINRDAVDYELQIEEGGDEAVTRSVTIEAGEMLELCEDGCTIELGNGERESFEGTETVELRDGGFVLAN